MSDPTFDMTLAHASVQYDQDFNLWIKQTVDLLKSQRFDELDIENLIDELESMSKRDQREILSRLTVLLIHRLKRKYQPDRQTRSWDITIWNNRQEIEQIVEDSPSLRSYPAAVLDKAYTAARRGAVKETGLPLSTFPERCPFTIEQTLDEEC